LEDELQTARKSVDDAQEKLAAAAAERAAAAAARDKELWARDAEVRRLQSKVEAAEAAAAARRAEAERLKELAELRVQEAQAADRSRTESSLAFDAQMQAALQKQHASHQEELRIVSRDRARDAARLQDAEATIQALRAEIVLAEQRIAAADAATQEARAGAEVLLQQVKSVHERAEVSRSKLRPQTADSDAQPHDLRPASSLSHSAWLQPNRTPALDHLHQPQSDRAAHRPPLLIDVSQELLSPPTLPEYVATPPLPPPARALRSAISLGGRPTSAANEEGVALAEENKKLRAAVQDMRLQLEELVARAQGVLLIFSLLHSF
jgi:hypothetical protein